jgi:membrane protease subunit (stomatin/prohibitin family)
MEGVVLGLQQLERQQAEQEQKRQALAIQQQQAAPQDSEDDDTAPSSAQNSNTNELMEPGAHDEGDKSSSIGRFLQNTRVRSHYRHYHSI